MKLFSVLFLMVVMSSLAYAGGDDKKALSSAVNKDTAIAMVAVAAAVRTGNNTTHNNNNNYNPHMGYANFCGSPCGSGNWDMNYPIYPPISHNSNYPYFPWH